MGPTTLGTMIVRPLIAALLCLPVLVGGEPRVHLPQTTFELGEVLADRQYVEVPFVVENRGDAPLVLGPGFN